MPASMNVLPKNTGWIEVICGPMFSGKTEELIRRLKRAQHRPAEGADLQAVASTAATPRRRSSATASRSSSRRRSSRPRRSSSTLRPDTQVVGIDEVQFFGADGGARSASSSPTGACGSSSPASTRTTAACPSSPMPQLLAVAEYITKELAVCVVCGNPAHRSQRLSADERRILVGARGAYEARCRACFRAEGDEPTDQAPASRPSRPAHPYRRDADTMRDSLYDHCQFRLSELEHRYGAERPHPREPVPAHPARDPLRQGDHPAGHQRAGGADLRRPDQDRDQRRAAAQARWPSPRA